MTCGFLSGFLPSFSCDVIITQLFDWPFNCDVIMKKSANKCDVGPLAIGQMFDCVIEFLTAIVILQINIKRYVSYSRLSICYRAY